MQKKIIIFIISIFSQPVFADDFIQINGFIKQDKGSYSLLVRDKRFSFKKIVIKFSNTKKQLIYSKYKAFVQVTGKWTTCNKKKCVKIDNVSYSVYNPLNQ